MCFLKVGTFSLRMRFSITDLVDSYSTLQIRERLPRNLVLSVTSIPGDFTQYAIFVLAGDILYISRPVQYTYDDPTLEPEKKDPEAVNWPACN